MNEIINYEAINGILEESMDKICAAVLNMADEIGAVIDESSFDFIDFDDCKSSGFDNAECDGIEIDRNATMEVKYDEKERVYRVAGTLEISEIVFHGKIEGPFGAAGMPYASEEVREETMSGGALSEAERKMMETREIEKRNVSSGPFEDIKMTFEAMMDDSESLLSFVFTGIV